MWWVVLGFVGWVLVGFALAKVVVFCLGAAGSLGDYVDGESVEMGRRWRGTVGSVSPEGWSIVANMSPRGRMPKPTHLKVLDGNLDDDAE